MYVKELVKIIGKIFTNNLGRQHRLTNRAENPYLMGCVTELVTSAELDQEEASYHQPPIHILR